MEIQNRPINIIHADDDSEDRNMFEEALTEANPNADLTTVDNGVALMEHLSNADEPNPDLIFLDINMPMKTGHEIVEEIRSDAQFDNIPVVMLSTSDAKRDVEEAYSKGANLYIRKPNYVNQWVKMFRKIFTYKLKEYLPKPKKEKFVLDSWD